MSIITREQAKDLRNAFQCWQQDYDPVEDKEQYDMFGLGIVAMDALLASLEAEAVAYVMADDLKDSRIISTPAYRDLGEAMERTVGDVVALYTTPPAPVSVPDDGQGKPHPVMAVKGELGFLDHFDRIISERDEDIDIGQLGCSNYDALMLAALDAFRAAMLQGADGNSPVIPDGWVACSERMPDNRGKSRELYVCWGTYFDGAEPDYIPALFFIHPTNGWCEWEPLEDDCDPKKVVITHWMPMPAAPLQEAE
ncbi:DUF551 domain-containing protein [Citrobacter cronae]|uniref:DUF551 domain-containing protein n=1 Tax=Citrobacter cronae TaxID=1748967 RepID=UPI0035109C77